MSPTTMTAAFLDDMEEPTAPAVGSSSRPRPDADDAGASSTGLREDGGCGSSSSDSGASSGARVERRRPLGTIQGNFDDGGACGGGGGKRIAGPNEENYRRNYDPLVADAIARYRARTQTNLRRDSLPDFVRMSAQERCAALLHVDRLLERLGDVSIHASASEGDFRSKLNPGGQRMTSADGSGARQDETFGSANTLGDGGYNETRGSETTLGESSNEGSKRQSTDLATTLDNNKSLASATTLGGCEQSASLLDESMALLSDDEVGGADEDEESLCSGGNDGRRQKRSPGVAPVERSRHRDEDPYERSISFAAGGRTSKSATPPFSADGRPSKRCATNSGKRGLKSRHRSGGDGGGGDDDSFLARFSGIGVGDCTHGLLHDQEDAFSCGSPILRRFSGDGLESDDEDGDETRDRLDHLRIHENGMTGKGFGGGKGTAHGGNEREDDCSRFSFQEDDDNVCFNGGNDGDLYDGDYYNDNHNNGDIGGPYQSQSQKLSIGTQNNQLSQWSTFRNADAELTHFQLDGKGEEDDESPVRRRAIRFDVASQMAALRSQRGSQRSSLASGDEEGADLGVEDRQRQSSKKSNADDEDPIQTVRNLCRRAKSQKEQGVDSSLLEEVAPIDVRLRDGMHYRLDALRTRQGNEKKKLSKSSKKTTKMVSVVRLKGERNWKRLRAGARCDSSDSEVSLSDPEPSFKDPISNFPSRVATRLNAGLSFLIQKEVQRQKQELDLQNSEEFTDSCSSAILLSMTIRQILCVACKLLMQTAKSARQHQRTRNRRPTSARRYTPSSDASWKEKPYLAGATLIVLRGKEDISQWEVALREFTSLSVLDHASMQSNLRKLVNTAGRCAGFDVVLTTYDAIKSKEVTVPVDSSGCAILGESAISSGEWLAVRDASGTQSGAVAPQKCHQLSVLHRMSWYRVIFMDILGRKGFLIKPGTARAQAAVAVNSKSRFAFFEKDDADSKAEAKFKDDRRQLRSIVTSLHLPEGMKLDKLISAYILDVNQVGKSSEVDNSSDNEYDSEDELSDDNLTEPW